MFILTQLNCHLHFVYFNTVLYVCVCVCVCVCVYVIVVFVYTIKITGNSFVPVSVTLRLVGDGHCHEILVTDSDDAIEVLITYSKCIRQAS